MDVFLQFKECFLKLISLKNGSKYAIATSGGSDSMALCILLQKLLKEFNYEFEALIIDHKLRKNSTEEANVVKNELTRINIKAKILTWTGEKPKSNIQELARIARYNLLTNYCKLNNIEYLLTAHHKDDQVENFLIRLEHGSGIYGLAGIPPVTIYNSVKILRPLLNLTKNELRNHLIEHNVKWVEDPSNENENFTRIKFRKLLQEFAFLKEPIYQASINLSKAKDAIEYYINFNFQELVFFHNKKAFVDLEKFNQLPQEIKFRLIGKIIWEVNKVQPKLRGERINRLLEKLQLGKEFKASTLGGCIVKRKKDKIIVELENKNLYLSSAS